LRGASLLKVFFSSLILWVSVSAALADSTPELFKLLPREIGGFRQSQSIRPPWSLTREGVLNPEIISAKVDADSPFIGAEVEYLSKKGEKLLVEVARFRRDSEAYSLLTIIGRNLRERKLAEDMVLGGDVGTASISWSGGLAFFKGSSFVRVSRSEKENSDSIRDLARLFSDEIEKGDGDIPVLLTHLPGWTDGQERAVYLAGFTTLKGIATNQPVLDVISSEGDADAVATDYGTSQLLLIEFNTPQLAGDNDRSITAKIQELRNQGQPVPTAYRRVGNYAVFVFNGQSEQAANQLIDQIKYEQVVRWLGDNPYLLQEAQRKYAETTLGVFVSVVKASGLALVSCLAVGGFFGALLFSRRRAQQKAVDAFSDAGGMLRLNLDEMTPQTDPARLIGPGN
jgi:hypothetical protein